MLMLYVYVINVSNVFKSTLTLLQQVTDNLQFNKVHKNWQMSEVHPIPLP